MVGFPKMLESGHFHSKSSYELLAIQSAKIHIEGLHIDISIAEKVPVAG